MVDLIYDYLQNRVGNALVQKDYSPRIMEILNKIALELKKTSRGKKSYVHVTISMLG